MDIGADAARRRLGESALGDKAESAAPKTPTRFPALSLDTHGAPIAVMHSDVGFAMLFGEPSQSELRDALSMITRDYPGGLMTPAGLVVANATFAARALAAEFDQSCYHGAVVWSWQQALILSGIERQLKRATLSPATRTELSFAHQALVNVISATDSQRALELWSWRIEAGEFVPIAFGERSSDETEENGAQLWSTVYLRRRNKSVRQGE